MEFPKIAVTPLILRRVGFVMLGALGGFAYYYFIGCTGGSCPITGNPWASTAYGAVIGLVVTIEKKRPDNSATQKN